MVWPRSADSITDLNLFSFLLKILKMEKKTKNLMEGLLSEIDRVTEIRREYLAVPAGFIAASLMQIDLNDAKKSITNGDVVQMLAAYSKLKEYEL